MAQGAPHMVIHRAYFQDNHVAHCDTLLQVWPDYLHEAKFPQSILQPGEVYHNKWYLHFYTRPAVAAAAPLLAPTSVAVEKAASVKPAPAPGV